MSKYSPFFLFLLWIGYILITSILLFTNGFLLTRTQHDKNASYTPKSLIQKTLPNFLDEIITEPGQIPTENKIILIVIDALRYDFTVFNKSLENPASFQNKLLTIHELLENNSNSRLYQFIADPPTTTMQRLKGITTGSLPTFIDAGSNFASSEINEDNIIDQLIKGGHNVICMGDDTWDNLYPRRFTRHYFQPSFNVWDLDTVDNEVSSHIFNEIEKEDWSVIIGHYLGVDHCGHRYGPNHPEMSRKLTEMDKVIRNVVDKMDNKTVLFVIGDHGMTNTGDHGGESESEVTAAMFVHTKQPLSDNILSNTLSFNAVRQVDLVPTIAHIMGVPIPYSNLGAVILDSVPKGLHQIQSNTTPWLNTLHSIWSNVVQVNRYISEYENTTGSLTADTAFNVQEDFEQLRKAFKQIANRDDFQLFAVSAYKFIKNVRLSCERVWTQFDAYAMSRGLLLTSFVAIAVYFIVNGIPAKLDAVITSKFMLLAYVCTAICVVGGFVIYSFSITNHLLNTIYFATGLFAVAYLFILVTQKFEQISTELHNSWRKRGWVEIVSRIIFILTFIMVFANSFIINEAKVMKFLCVTLTILIALDFNYNSVFEVRNFTRKIVLSILFVICLVLKTSVYFWGCRDEDNCISLLNKWGNSNKLQLFLAFSSVSLYVVSSKVWLRACGNLTGYNINVLVAKYMPFVIVLCCSGIWVVQHIPREQLITAWQSNALAWIIYAFVILAIINVFVNPLHIYILPSKQSSVVENKNIIPHLFKQMRDMFGTTKGSTDIPIVYGLATVYTSAFLLATLYFSLVYLLLLGDIVTPGGILMLFLACLVITLCAISRYEKSQSIESLLDVPFSQVLLWFALSIYAFYGTKHQPTFTNIVWESAFVGTSGTFVSNIMPATLIVINTFGSYIIFGFTLPLLVIGPFSLYVIFPSLSNKKHGAFKNLSKGDFTLIDLGDAFGGSIFSVCCKYILCHTIRTFGCMLSATIHCRHLMVWAIFAPKLIFDALGTFLTIVAVLLGYLLIIRIQITLNSFVVAIQKAK